MINTKVLATAVIATVCTLPALAEAGASIPGTTWIYPSETSYITEANSPWTGGISTWSYYYNETFEDGLLNTPGLSADFGVVRDPHAHTDSVDGDDGTLDGNGSGGHSWFVKNPVGVDLTFQFDAQVLGDLPTHAGLVWTDGTPDGEVTLEAYDAQENLIGMMSMVLGGDEHLGGTEEDRFIGVSHAGGISSLVIRTAVGSLEVDHVQYGFDPGAVPAPGALALLGLAGAVSRRRRRA